LAGTHVVKDGYLDAENTNVVVTSGQTTPVNFQLTALPAPIAVKVRIAPNTHNTASKGKFVAFITLPNNYKAADVDAKSVVCEGAPALRLIRIKAFPNTFTAIFNRDKLVNVKPGDNVQLTVTGTINKNGGKVGFSGSDLIKVTSKKGTTKETIDDVEKMTDENVFNQFNPR
jgi:hypothetical protein